MTEDRDPVLDEIWATLQPLLIGMRDQFFEAIAELGLTPPHCQALMALADGPIRMRDIADHLACDASYVTAIVDNLEHLGLAERRTSAADRRVKEIALTARGRAASDQLDEAMTTPPTALRQLSVADRKALARILAKLEFDESTDGPWPRPVWRRTHR